MNNIIANLRRDRPLSWENRLEAADEIFRLREENARLREALTLFAAKEPVQLTYEGRDFIKAIPVSESELEAARAAIREGLER